MRQKTQERGAPQAGVAARPSSALEESSAATEKQLACSERGGRAAMVVCRVCEDAGQSWLSSISCRGIFPGPSACLKRQSAPASGSWPRFPG